MAKYNSDIRMYQAALQVLKDGSGKPFYDGDLDGDKTTHNGVSGRNLSNAIKAFEKENGLPVIGNMEVTKPTFKKIDGMLTPKYENMVAMKARTDEHPAPVFTCDPGLLNPKPFNMLKFPLPITEHIVLRERLTNLKNRTKLVVHIYPEDCDITIDGEFTVTPKFKGIEWLKNGSLGFKTDRERPIRLELWYEIASDSTKVWKRIKNDKKSYIIKSDVKYSELEKLPVFDAKLHLKSIGLSTSPTNKLAQKICVAATLLLKGGKKYKSDADSEQKLIFLTRLVAGLDNTVAKALIVLAKKNNASGKFNGVALVTASSITKMSTAGLKFLGKKEGVEKKKFTFMKNGKQVTEVRHQLYDDPQNCTIGHGHLVHLGKCVFNNSNSDEIPYLNGLDDTGADALLTADLKTRFNKLKTKLGKAKLTQPMFDALLSYYYNAQDNANDAIKLTISGDYFEAAQAFKSTTVVGGGFAGGLANRRGLEARLYLTGQY